MIKTRISLSSIGLWSRVGDLETKTVYDNATLTIVA